MNVEKQLLPNAALKATYDKVSWLYVFRDFSRSERDRAAERIEIRFGVSSYPQIFLANPESFKILRHTGRSVDSFLAAVDGTAIEKPAKNNALKETHRAELLAAKLEKSPSLALANKCLGHKDVVVRYRALSFLIKKKPKMILKQAAALLQTPNDRVRYDVCDVLKKLGSIQHARMLESLVKDPKNSLNPNVLRIRAVDALANCGDRDSIAVIAPYAASGEYFNGLTGKAIDTLVSISRKDKKARAQVVLALKKAYPPPATDGDERAKRACVALAKRVHRAIGGKRPFPKTYDEEARRKLMR